jgi:hypothetical protein
VLGRTKEKSVWETCLCLALLRAQAKESSHCVASGQDQKAGDVGRRMSSSIAREACREAELRGGCGMLAVEAMEGAWPLLSLAVQPAQSMQLANPEVMEVCLKRAGREVDEDLREQEAQEEEPGWSVWAEALVDCHSVCTETVS